MKNALWNYCFAIQKELTLSQNQEFLKPRTKYHRKRSKKVPELSVASTLAEESKQLPMRTKTISQILYQHKPYIGIPKKKNLINPRRFQVRDKWTSFRIRMNFSLWKFGGLWWNRTNMVVQEIITSIYQYNNSSWSNECSRKMMIIDENKKKMQNWNRKRFSFSHMIEMVVGKQRRRYSDEKKKREIGGCLPFFFFFFLFYFSLCFLQASPVRSRPENDKCASIYLR